MSSSNRAPLGAVMTAFALREARWNASTSTRTVTSAPLSVRSASVRRWCPEMVATFSRRSSTGRQIPTDGTRGPKSQPQEKVALRRSVDSARLSERNPSLPSLPSPSATSPNTPASRPNVSATLGGTSRPASGGENRTSTSFEPASTSVTSNSAGRNMFSCAPRRTPFNHTSATVSRPWKTRRTRSSAARSVGQEKRPRNHQSRSSIHRMDDSLSSRYGSSIRPVAISDSCTPPGTIAGTQSASAIDATSAPGCASASWNSVRKVLLRLTCVPRFKDWDHDMTTLLPEVAGPLHTSLGYPSGYQMEEAPVVIDPAELAATLKRLKRVQGQIGGIITMIEQGRDCREIVTQVAAASKALDRAGFSIIATGLRECVLNEDSEYDSAQMEKLFLSLA